MTTVANSAVSLTVAAKERPRAPNSRSQPERRLLRLKPAANYLSVSPWTLRGIIQRGELPVVRYGENTQWLIDVRDLDSWVEAHKENF